ncbi:MAG: NAD-dependent epimerase/dehydratase family protein [Acidobacteriota bacterium]|nr:NAD-dependent epimerase/dehydratase family protein [Acidobacteriota bacterium]
MERSIQRAVVTGAGGFIGSALVQYLKGTAREVVAVSRRPLPDLGCPAHVLDVTRQGVLDDLLDKHTVVFHLAAGGSVPRSVHSPRADFEDGVCAWFEVLESVRKADCQVIFPSTGSVFDPSSRSPLSETAYVRPTSPYAAGKATGEAYAAAYHRSYGLNVKVARMFSVYGIGMNRFVIYDLVQRLRNNPSELSILGDGTQVRDYLYIDDAVRGLVRIATHGEPGENYNLGSGIAVKVIDLARKVAGLMGQPDIPISPSGEPLPGEVLRWYADISKIRKIGFAPEVSLEEGLARTVRWLAEMNLQRASVLS